MTLQPNSGEVSKLSHCLAFLCKRQQSKSRHSSTKESEPYNRNWLTFLGCTGTSLLSEYSSA